MRVHLRAHRAAGGRLDDPGVLGSNESQTVESSQVAVHLLLEAQPGPDLPAQTHPKLEHDRPR